MEYRIHEIILDFMTCKVTKRSQDSGFKKSNKNTMHNTILWQMIRVTQNKAGLTVTHVKWAQEVISYERRS